MHKEGDGDVESSSGAGEVQDRGSWGSPMEFLMSGVSFAVGLGNVWRFPQLAYRNGGGTFLICYIIMIASVGFPLFFLETSLGQYAQSGPALTFGRMAPIFQGLGYCSILLCFCITTFYNVVMAWSLFYAFSSFGMTLGWSVCDYDFNTDFCYSVVENRRCLDQSPPETLLTYYNKTCVSVDGLCSQYGFEMKDYNSCFNGSTEIRLRHLIRRVLASEEYYDDFAMGASGASWDNWGVIRWELVGCLVLAWVLCYLCIFKGITATGKVVYFTAVLPFLIIIALVVRSALLPGAVDGILFYLTPDWKLLLSANIWGEAASQAFFSLGIGNGALFTLSSYNRFGNNCHRDSWFIGFFNILTALFAGLSTFATIGFMSQELDEPVSSVVQSGPGLTFIAYPEALLRITLPQLWTVLFFLMLFTVGLGSQFAGVEALSTAIVDQWPSLRSRRPCVNGGVCAACFVFGLPMCFSGGVLLVTLLENYIVSWAIMLVGFTELLLVAWTFGGNKFIKCLDEMGLKFCKFTRSYWFFSWTVLAPLSLGAVIIFTLNNYQRPYYESYVFPDWVQLLGIVIGSFTLLPIPAFAVYRLVLGQETGWNLLRPAKQWTSGIILSDKMTPESEPMKVSPDLDSDNPESLYANSGIQADT